MAFGSSFVGAFIGSAVSSAALSFLAPWTRQFHYEANRWGGGLFAGVESANVIPDFQQIVANWYRGNYASRAALLADLRYLGISPNYDPMWDAIIDAGQPTWSPETWLQWWRQGRLNRPGVDPDGRRMINWALTRYGYSEMDQSRLRNSYDNLPIGAADEARRREIIGEDFWLATQAAQGFIRTEEQQVLAKLRQPLLGAGDLLKAGARQSFDNQVATALDLDEGMPEETRAGLRSLGFWDTQRGISNPPADILWRNSRLLPPGELGTLATARLSRDNLFKFRGLVPGVEEFTQADLDRLLQAQGYPKKFRPMIQAMSYAEPRVMSMKRGMKYSVFTQAQLARAFEARGYTPTDAKQEARVAEIEVQAAQIGWLVTWNDTARKRLQACVTNAYQVGIITDVQCRNLLTSISQPVLAWQMLDHNGHPNPQAVAAIISNTTLAIVQAADLCQTVDLVKGTIQAIKRSFLDGTLPLQTATQALGKAGIVTARALRYANVWSAQFTVKRRYLATGQVLSLVRQGFLSPAAALIRLTNLGWDRPDALLLDDQAAAAFTRSQAALQRAATPKISLGEMKKLAADGDIPMSQLESYMQGRNYPDSYIKAVVKMLEKKAAPGKKVTAKNATLAMLKDWVKKGVISEDQFKAGCHQLGWSVAMCAQMLKADLTAAPTAKELAPPKVPKLP